MGGISQSTEKRNEKTDPDYPPTITRGNRNFKRVGDAYAYLDKVAERAREKPKISHGISDRNKEVAEAARAGERVTRASPRLGGRRQRHSARPDVVR